MIVCDSDVLIDALRGREPAAERISAEIESGILATTAITEFELRSGAKSRDARAAVTALLAPLLVLPFDAAAADAAAGIRRELEAGGAPIGMADYLIAGICLSRAAVLLTRDRAHFQRVPDLRLGRLREEDR